jgi:hypothetical protein
MPKMREILDYYYNFSLYVNENLTKEVLTPSKIFYLINQIYFPYNEHSLKINSKKYPK